MFCLELVLMIIGWIVIPIAVLFKVYKHDILSAVSPEMCHFTSKLMFIWDNYEDGICAGRQYHDFGANWKQIIYWSCIRNPVNNLRITPYLSCKINPTEVRYSGSLPVTKIFDYDTKISQWFFAWQGIYSNFYYQFIAPFTIPLIMKRGELRRFWIGWAIYPTDIFGVSNYRKHGAGFKSQWKAVK